MMVNKNIEVVVVQLQVDWGFFWVSLVCMDFGYIRVLGVYLFGMVLYCYLVVF